MLCGGPQLSKGTQHTHALVRHTFTRTHSTTNGDIKSSPWKAYLLQIPQVRKRGQCGERTNAKISLDFLDSGQYLQTGTTAEGRVDGGQCDIFH